MYHYVETITWNDGMVSVIQVESDTPLALGCWTDLSDSVVCLVRDNA